jgi:HSP20 family molecular chaperone IbpA
VITCEELRGGRDGADDIFEILVTTFKTGRKTVVGEGDLTWRPATDVYETEDAFVVQMDLSGMEPAGIEVLTDGEVLVVRGTRRDIAPPGKKHYFTMEINVGPFTRRVPIPIDVDPLRAIARYCNGFLFVSLPTGGQDGGSAHRRIDVATD